MSLKVVKFDTKMYLNLSNFWGRASAGGGGGGDKPWSKNGGKCRMGGLTKFSPDGGGPPQKKSLQVVYIKWLLSWAPLGAYIPGGHSHSLPTKVQTFWPHCFGGLSPKNPIFFTHVTQIPPFLNCHEKTHFFPQRPKFSETFHPKTPSWIWKVDTIFKEKHNFYLNDPYFDGFVTKRPHFFCVWHVTERPLVWRCQRHMHITLKYECPRPLRPRKKKTLFYWRDRLRLSILVGFLFVCFWVFFFVFFW